MKGKLDKIKKIIQNNVGTACSISSKTGRKNLFFENCVIDAAYPEIFVVKYTDGKHNLEKNMSFAYTDLLIKKVSICASKKSSKNMGA